MEARTGQDRTGSREQGAGQGAGSREMTDSQAVDNNGGWLVGGSPLAGGLAPAETAQGEPDAMPKGESEGNGWDMDGIWMGYAIHHHQPKGVLLADWESGWMDGLRTYSLCGVVWLAWGTVCCNLKDSWQELNHPKGQSSPLGIYA
ncbi:predicted protein [Histoplasma capsulatum G186AR]|uniref:Uncharacterized protein n=1 Tax=Ajellomyces capsulatus (strain G186AR / H82 / ATCC MYA-2454 / RMSCC 2432) TaxID=447093 RepID=C0NKE5_AJECG|nr:uncharacterized protein HCBG_03625 [Histoplasma capsulatum G186AR]EEH08336.1 predicted protein [Histoplasma capsulatum G186AR]